jgi:hypothetical protein
MLSVKGFFIKEKTESQFISLYTGTTILCKSGHEVCDVIQDIYKGSSGYSKCIGNWRPGQTPAKYGDVLPLLCKCGEPYFEKFRFEWIR